MHENTSLPIKIFPILCVFALASTTVLCRAEADAGPDWYPNNGALAPDKPSSIILKKLKMEFAYTKYLQLESHYSFENSGKNAEVVTISFPVCDLTYERDVRESDFCGIKRDEIVVKVDGQPHQTTPQAVAAPDTESEGAAVTVEFEVRFEPGQTREVFVSYPPVENERRHYNPHDTFVTYDVSINDCASFEGNVDEIQISLSLPYPAHKDSARLSPLDNQYLGTFTSDGNRYVWKEKEFEPGIGTLSFWLLHSSEHELRERLRVELQKDPGNTAAQIAYASSLIISDKTAYKRLMAPALRAKYPSWSEKRIKKLVNMYYDQIREFDECHDGGCVEGYCGEEEALVGIHRIACFKDRKCLEHVDNIHDACCWEEDDSASEETMPTAVIILDTGTGTRESEDTAAALSNEDTDTKAAPDANPIVASKPQPSITSTVVPDEPSFETHELIILSSVVLLVLVVLFVLYIRRRSGD